MESDQSNWQSERRSGNKAGFVCILCCYVNGDTNVPKRLMNSRKGFLALGLALLNSLYVNNYNNVYSCRAGAHAAKQLRVYVETWKADNISLTDTRTIGCCGCDKGS